MYLLTPVCRSRSSSGSQGALRSLTAVNFSSVSVSHKTCSSSSDVLQPTCSSVAVLPAQPSCSSHANRKFEVAEADKYAPTLCPGNLKK